MASWMVHLRIAESMLAQIPGLDENLFAIGNIAPDSGIPDEKWEHFDPPASVTHFLQEKGAPYHCGDLAFFRQYLLPVWGETIDPARFSFLWGYFFHLLTDNIWARRIGRPIKQRYATQFTADPSGTRKMVNNERYGLDLLYVRAHPDSLFWRVFLHCQYDRNDLVFLPVDAVQQRIAYIQTGYQRWDADMETLAAGPFTYLTSEQLEEVVAETSRLCLEAYRLLWMEKINPGEEASVLALLVDRLGNTDQINL
jgi:hypothetical protein